MTTKPMPLLVIAMGDIAAIAPEEERAPGVMLIGTREEVASWGAAGLLNARVFPEDPALLAQHAAEVATLRAEIEMRDAALALRPLDEWREDYGAVLWYRVPISEPPVVSSPLYSDWEERCGDWVTHWCPLPKVTP